MSKKVSKKSRIPLLVAVSTPANSPKEPRPQTLTKSLRLYIEVK